MCLIVLALRATSKFRLVVAANRDEWRERPAQAALWWPEHPGLLAGRDLQAGGTWLGLTRTGRFGAITNFRDPTDRRATARSRGELVAAFLLGNDPPATFLAKLVPHAGAYNGFNLIVGDGSGLHYLGSRAGEPRAISSGVHGLSNHLLDEPWPKVRRGCEAMEQALDDTDPAPRLFAMLQDTAGVPDAQLPDTGVGLAWEQRLAAPFITGADYGTRSSTVLTVALDGRASFHEKTWNAEGHLAGETRFDGPAGFFVSWPSNT